MNRGTKIRTALAVIMIINEALIRIGTVDFGNEFSNQLYRWVSFIFFVAAYVVSHYYNNDFTEDGAIGTGITRQRKAEKEKDYSGERFFDELIVPEEFDDNKEECIDDLCTEGEE